MSNLTPVLQACRPRQNIGDAETYAANLDKALTTEIATPDGATEFFSTTHATAAMKHAGRMVFGRLKNGAASGQPNIYRFTSVYGGGKTHTLITLAAAAKHPTLVREGKTQGVIPVEQATDGVKIVSFNGKDSNVIQGTLLDESGLRAKSLTGFIAYYVGGQEEFRRFEEIDQQRADPGGRDFARLLSNQPVLILIDELAEWIDRVLTQTEAKAENIRHTISSLLHAIDTSPHTVLVITTPEPGGSAFNNATMQLLNILNSVETTLTRPSHNMVPSSTEDLPAILRQRLFSSCDETVRREAAFTYSQIAQKVNPADHDAYNRFHQSYPFHPDLMSMIQIQLYANETAFQKVRGTIRMLSNLILGHQNEQDAFLHPYHVQMDNQRLHDHLIGGLHYEHLAAAITADVIGPASMAKRIGTDLAQYIANIILLGSLAPSDKNGIATDKIISAILSPRHTDPAIIRAAVAEYTQRSLFLDQNPNQQGHRFSQEPNVNKMVHDRKEQLLTHRQVIADALKDAVYAEYAPDSGNRDKNRIKVQMYPSRANNASDEKDAACLCILNPERFNWSRRDGNEHIIAELHDEKSGATGAKREHRNNILFLVADDDNLDSIRDHLATHMAAQSVKKEAAQNLHQNQIARLDEIISQEAKAVSQSIQNKWNHLIFPTGRNGFSNAAPHLTEEALTAATDQEGDGQVPIINKLVERLKVPDPARPRLNPNVWRQTALNAQENHQEGLPLGELHRVFTSSPGRQMMLSRQHFYQTIREALSENDLYMESNTQQVVTFHNANILLEDNFRVWIKGNEPRCSQCDQRTWGCQCQENPAPPLGEFSSRSDTSSNIQEQVQPLSLAPFTSQLVKADAAIGELRAYLNDREISWEGLGSLSISTTSPQELTNLADKIGPTAQRANFQADVSSDEGHITLHLENQSYTDWKTRQNTIERVIDYATKPDAKPVVNCIITLTADRYSPEDYSAVANAMDNRHDVVVEAEFRQP